uniref:Uncharacterized protein n=1 Tax=Octopus bimaculoides TaxID=37653 RepID=A0A0L8I3L4_OCTBM
MINKVNVNYREKGNISWMENTRTIQSAVGI